MQNSFNSPLDALKNPSADGNSITNRNDAPPESKQHAYLVGICGSGMKALAEVLLDLGWKVTGADLQADSESGTILRAKGATVFDHHLPDQIHPGIYLLVYSTAVPEQNPERTRAGELGIVQRAYHEQLAELMKSRQGISISGTHGKSTTTSLTGWILRETGLDPTVLVGAQQVGQSCNGWAGLGPHLVAESCEYRQHFLQLTPQFAVILGIEADHFDCFQDAQASVAAYRAFAQRIPETGFLLYRGDCENARFACQDATTDIQTFSSTQTADWTAKSIHQTSTGYRFSLSYHQTKCCEIELKLPGQHQILNAMAAAILSHRAGASWSAISQAISTFQGIRRRFEFQQRWNQALVIHDYAHHPTAIKATLQTVRDFCPTRRIVCVFQPHQLSRTLGLWNEFVSCFQIAQQVFVLPVYGARETYQSELREASKELAQAVSKTGVASQFQGDLDQMRATLDDTLSPNDVLVTMGAGDIDRIHHARID